MERLKNIAIHIRCHRFRDTCAVNIPRADAAVRALRRLVKHTIIRAFVCYLLLANIAHLTYDGLQRTTWQIESLEAVRSRAFEHTPVVAVVRNAIASEALGNARKVASM
jgi:hypothetical protein